MLPRVVVVLVCLLVEVRGHGYMIDPPARSSLWRVNDKAPKNYNDMSVNCGGFEIEHRMEHGKCGVCGDPFNQPQPRDNEAGGRYGRGIISKHYKPGEEITIGIHVTANHKGFFEFRLCKNDDVTKIVQQSCLDQNLLQLKNGSGTSTRFFLPPQKLGLVEVTAILPSALTCSQCVLQWRWREGNFIGFGPDHVECAGCGPQVEFYGCSDIAIGQGTGQTMTNPPNHGPFGITNPPHPVTNAPMPTMPPTSGHIQTERWTNPPVLHGNGPFSNCHGTHHDSGLEKLDQWCIDSCQKGNCPDFLCECPDAFGTQPPTPKPTTKKPYTPPPVTMQPPTPAPVTKQPYTAAPVTKQPTPPSASNKGPQRLTGFNEYDGCRGDGLWGIGDIGLDNWCVENCSKGNCPSIMCKCP